MTLYEQTYDRKEYQSRLHFFDGKTSTKILLMYKSKYIWIVLTTFFILNKILFLVTANFVMQNFALKNAYQIMEKK